MARKGKRSAGKYGREWEGGKEKKVWDGGKIGRGGRELK